jgi:hypothetical protein
LGAEIPLEQRVLDGGRTYLALFDEIIVGFGPNLGGALFDQNRAYIALGVRVRDGVRVETGFMNQLLHWQGGRVLQYNNTVMFQIFSDLPLRRR